MAIQGARIGVTCDSTVSTCIGLDGCDPSVCPDFLIKRHDTKPDLKIVVDDCDGPLDLTDETLILEVNMWAKGKLKTAITNADTFFGLADNIGFEQIMVNDIIIMERVRLPEHMLVTGFDEQNKLIRVTRGFNGTNAVAWKKGNAFKIFRALNAPATIESTLEDVLQGDGTTATDQLTETVLSYSWTANDTCLPGCYLLEFKLLKMEAEMGINALMVVPSTVTPSFTPSTLTPADFGCTLGTGIEWVRRFPSNKEGFLIQINDSPTAETV